MDSQYVNRMMDRARTPSPQPDYAEFEQAVHRWQDHAANSSVPSHLEAALAALKAPTPSQPDPVAPAHREWEELSMLDLPVIVNTLNILTNRCDVARAAFDDALTKFEISTHIFLAKTSHKSVGDVGDYLGVLKDALIASRTIFAPQEAYRIALTTLGLLITDLVELLPKKHAVKKSVSAKLDDGLAKADKAEQTIRQLLTGLADPASKGRESYGLVVYMNTARQRLGNWASEQERFQEWSGECISVLL